MRGNAYVLAANPPTLEGGRALVGSAAEMVYVGESPTVRTNFLSLCMVINSERNTSKGLELASRHLTDYGLGKRIVRLAGESPARESNLMGVWCTVSTWRL